MGLSCCNPAIGSEVGKTKLPVVSGQDLTYEAAASLEGFYHFIHAYCLPRRGTVDMWWRYAGRDPLRQVRHLIIEKCSPVPELDLRAYKDANPLL
jgi:hypothetical protein